MAVYFDKYEIDIKMDNKEFDIDISQLSFSIKDSIHTLYPFLTVNIKDTIGYFQEYLLTMESIPIEISYGLNTDYITCPFVLVTEEIIDNVRNNVIAGNNLIRGLHAYYDNQEIISAGYKKRISSIIEELVNKYNFKSTDIDGTGSDSYWYQPLVNDAEFMERFLLPNCFSNDSQESPFFLFINLKNEFKLKSYHKMFLAQPSKTFFNVHKDLTDLQDDVIMDFKKFKPGSHITKPTRNREIFKFSKEDGSLITNSDSIVSYPNQTNKTLPLYKDSKKSSYLELWEEKNTSGDKEYIKALKINSMKNSLFLERFLITVYLDTTLNAGQTIELEIPHFKSEDNQDKSAYFSGKLLIEESEHVWDSSANQGQIGRGYTQLLCSRKYLPSLPTNNYQLVSKLQKS